MAMIECSKPAYDKLVDSGLAGKIIKREEKWRGILLGAYFDSEAYTLFQKAEEYFKNGLSFERKNSQYGDLYYDILLLKQEIETQEPMAGEKEELLIHHPTLLAYAVLGENLLNYEKYGFKSRRQLEESIASFCIGEQWNIGYMYGSRYIWRNGKYKNEFTNGMHGDMFFAQTDVSGFHKKQDTLFGTADEEFSTWKDVSGCSKSVYEFQNWQNILMIALRYAEAIGKGRIPEIINWREIEATLNGYLPATAEALFGSDHSGLEFVAELPILIEGIKLETFPLRISGYPNSVDYFPLVKENKLLIMVEDKQGKVVLYDKGYFEGKKFSVHMEFEESDLVDLLKGIYKLYSRDKTELPELMKLYLKNPHK